MFDIGWPEMLVIAIVLIVVVGPKDLPRMLRAFGKTTSKLRSMAGDFRKQFDEALKEAELDDVKTLATEARKLDPRSEIRKHLSPFEKAGEQVKAGMENVMKPQAAKAGGPASTEAHAAEPLKAGAAAVPGETPPATPNGAATGQAAKPAAGAKTAAPKAASRPATKSTAPKPRAAASKTAAKTPARGKKTTGKST